MSTNTETSVPPSLLDGPLVGNVSPVE